MRLLQGLALAAALVAGLRGVPPKQQPLKLLVHGPEVIPLSGSIFEVRLWVRADRSGSVVVRLEDTEGKVTLYDTVTPVEQRDQWIEFATKLPAQATLTLVADSGEKAFEAKITPPAAEDDTETFRQVAAYGVGVCLVGLYLWIRSLRRRVRGIENSANNPLAYSAVDPIKAKDLQTRLTGLASRVTAAEQKLLAVQATQPDPGKRITAMETTLQNAVEALRTWKRTPSPPAVGTAASTLLADLIKDVGTSLNESVDKLRKTLEGKLPVTVGPAEIAALSRRLDTIQQELKTWEGDRQRREKLLEHAAALESRIKGLESAAATSGQPEPQPPPTSAPEPTPDRVQEMFATISRELSGLRRQMAVPGAPTTAEPSSAPPEIRFDPCMLWTSAVQRITPEVPAGAQPSDYLAQLTALEGSLNEIVAPAGWSRLARLVHLTSVRTEPGGSAPAGKPALRIEVHSIRRDPDGTVACPADDGAVLTGREFYQIYLALDNPEDGTAYIFLPAGPFNSDRHTFVLNALLDERLNSAVRIYGMVEPAHLRRVQGNIYDVISKMRLLYECAPMGASA